MSALVIIGIYLMESGGVLAQTSAVRVYTGESLGASLFALSRAGTAEALAFLFFVIKASSS